MFPESFRRYSLAHIHKTPFSSISTKILSKFLIYFSQENKIPVKNIVEISFFRTYLFVQVFYTFLRHDIE